jgi:Glycosyl-hydrolase family 116, catalytic region
MINTYDIEFWGADSLCTSLYLSALKAATLMGESLGDNIERYSTLLAKGSRQMEEQLFNGDYFFQKTTWQNLRAQYPREDDDSPNYPEFRVGEKGRVPPINTAKGVSPTACSEHGFP